jgi:hypothetical protein
VQVTPVDRAVTYVEIPTVEAAHALASVAAEQTKVSWCELQLRSSRSKAVLGEYAAFTAS